ncbi:MAG: CUB domain-containing protein, partial [Saprospiraceae bacterium]|nr:CUB domain-containing protein [Saprospiraceae bacterium]
MKRSLLLQAAALLFPLLLVGQPEYYMTNLVVDDCEGILYDSELGDPGGNYDHNENYTFSICIPGADQIIMTFLYFCTEADFDSLRIYDGPDTLSLLIGTYTGEPDPPVIIATSGCLTLNFVSDPNVSCTGWEAHWETVVEIPPPPDILPLDDLPCESNTMTVVFAEQIPCDSLYPSAFAINGPISPTITNVQPVGCSGGYTNTVNLSFSPMIDFSGNYQVSFTNSVTICETVYTLTST